MDRNICGHERRGLWALLGVMRYNAHRGEGFLMQAKKRKYESVRQLQRQSAILACARQVLEEQGYSGLTMRGLAKRAGVAPATLYNLYGSKDDLIVAAVDDLLTEMAERAMAMDVAPGLDALLTMTELTAEQVQSTPKYAEAMTRALFNVQQGDPLVAGLFARGYPFRARQLRIAQQKGHLRPEVDVDVVAKHLTGAGWGQMLLWVMGLFTLAECCKEQIRSELMTLVSIARGTTRKRLEQSLDKLGWDSENNPTDANQRIRLDLT